jgi:hypothetical protein
MMKFNGPLAEILMEIKPEVYENCVLEEGNEKVIYV